LSKLDEQVLVVPRSSLFGGEVWQGMRLGPTDAYLERIRAHGAFKRRGDVEDDPLLKQIIPYLLVRRGEEIFLFQRTDRGGDARLHHRYSIGIGGHINHADARGTDPINSALRREIEEELAFQRPWTARLLGVLNDDRNAVGQVHFGLVYEVSTDGDVTVRETDALAGAFVPLSVAEEHYDRMETWSQLVMEGMGWR
jgi:predicted NUDIX family phosphoesterase